MNGAGFEDTVFLLNIRIRMVRDTMRLNPSGELFMDKCMDDIAFIDEVLSGIVRQASREGQPESEAWIASIDYVSDTEWQFSQLLTEFLLESNAFSARTHASARGKVVSLRDESNGRRKVFEKFVMAQGDSEETVVGPTELSILFGGA